MTFFTAAPRRLVLLAAIISGVSGASLVGSGAAPGVASELGAAARYTRVSLPAAQNPAEKVLDHFLCYRVTTGGIQLPGAVSLLDQFFRKPVAVGLSQRSTLCTPAEKDTTAGAVLARIKFPRAHLVCYTTKRLPVPAADRTVLVKNQFSPKQILHPSVLVQLCLPSGKVLANSTAAAVIPTTLDHFSCYAVTGATLQRPLYIRDQFTRLRGNTKYSVVVIRPFLLCNPAEKFVDGKQRSRVRFPRAHLVCYTLKVVVGGFTGQKVLITNQFERNREIGVLRPFSLCVPSLKTIIKAAAG